MSLAEADPMTGPLDDAPPAVGGSSLLDRLRARREALTMQRTVDMPVPGYGGDLVVRLRSVEWLELRRIAERAGNSRDPRAELYGQADAIAAATVEVLGPEGAALAPDGAVVQFDARLAELLGFEPAENSARAVVLGVFAGNDLGLAALFVEWQAWLQSATQEVDGEFAEG